MARKLYAYAAGVNSEDVEASAFKAAYKAFADSGYPPARPAQGPGGEPGILQRTRARCRDASAGQTKLAAAIDQETCHEA